MSAGPRGGVPDRDDLLEAVAECLRDELLPDLAGRARYLLQVCLSALEMVRREEAHGQELAAAEQAFRSETGTVDDAALVAEIRAGVDEARAAQLVEALVRRNRADLAVVRPDRLDTQSSGRQ